MTLNRSLFRLINLGLVFGLVIAALSVALAQTQQVKAAPPPG